MRSRINERTRHTTTQAARVGGNRRASRSRATTGASGSTAMAKSGAGTADGGAALWTAPASIDRVEAGPKASKRTRATAVSSVPVDWSAVRGQGR